MKIGLYIAAAAAAAALSFGVVMAQPKDVARVPTAPVVQAEPTQDNNAAKLRLKKNPGPRPTSCSCSGKGRCSLTQEKDGSGWRCSPTKGNACNTLCSVTLGKKATTVTPQ